MKIILAACIALISGNAIAQTRVIDVGKANTGGTAPSNLFYAMGGVPMNNAKYVAFVEGTPFFNESFTRGKIVLSGGRIYNNIKLRLDLMDNTLQYISPEGEELIATTPIKTVFLTDSATQKENQFDHSGQIMTLSKIETAWYQMLDTGVLSLYKRHHKTIRENKPYGSATVDQYITNAYSYYMLINSVFTPIKKIKALPDMLQDKKTELKEYIINNNLTGKSDKEYRAVVGYYNSLIATK
ncbi:MAG: hypothetical protein WAR80_07310 [Ferruginibacter sp.]